MSIQKYKERALEVVDEETWDKYFRAYKNANKNINDVLIARAVLGHLGKKSSSQKSQLELYDAKSVNGYKPPCALNVVLYVINSIDRESKQGNMYRMHIVMDRDYNVFNLMDFNRGISGVTGKHCMFKNIVLDEYMSGLSLKATMKTEVGTTTKRFESPQPQDDFSGLEKNKYYVLEGWGEPGSFGEKLDKEGYRFGVHWRLIDDDENSVIVNLFEEQIDKLLKKGIDVENLDWCDVTVQGVYKETKRQREDGGGYIIYKNLNALDVEVKQQLQKPEDIESHINKTPSNRTDGQDSYPEITTEQLKEVLPQEPDEFLEWLDEKGIDDPESYYDKLMRKGLIVEEDDDVVLVEQETQEDQPSNRTGNQETPSGRSETESSTIIEEETVLPEEAVKKIMKFIRDGGKEGVKYTDITEQTGIEEAIVEEVVNTLLMDKEIEEPYVGHVRVVDKSSTRTEFDSSKDTLMLTMAQSLHRLDTHLEQVEKYVKGVPYDEWKQDVEQKLNKSIDDEAFQERIDYMENVSGDIYSVEVGKYKRLT